MSEEIEQIRHAVLGEYGRYFRLAELPIGNIYKASTVIDVPVPDEITAYVAHTVIYTPMKPPLIVADYAFCLKDRICIVLHNELPCPGMTHGESIKLFMDAMVEVEDKEKQEWEAIISQSHVKQALIRLAEEAKKEGITDE